MKDAQAEVYSPYFWTAKSMQKLPAVMASGRSLPTRVHFENAHLVNAQSDFSRAVVQTMLILHPSRPVGFIPLIDY